MLYNREAILEWNYTEMRKVKKELTPPQKIRIVEHKAWQVSGFQILKTLSSTVIEMLQITLKIIIIESFHGPY